MVFGSTTLPRAHDLKVPDWIASIKIRGRPAEQFHGVFVTAGIIVRQAQVPVIPDRGMWVQALCPPPQRNAFIRFAEDREQLGQSGEQIACGQEIRPRSRGELGMVRKHPQRGKWCRGLRIYSDPSRVGPIRDQ